MTSKAELYNLVIELRAHHWPQAAVASCLGISQRRVSQIEIELRANVSATPFNQLPYLLRERIVTYQRQQASRLEVEVQRA